MLARFLPADDAQPLETARVARKERGKIIASVPFKKEGGEQEAHAQQDIKPTIALAKNLGTLGTSSQLRLHCPFLEHLLAFEFFPSASAYVSDKGWTILYEHNGMVYMSKVIPCET